MEVTELDRDTCWFIDAWAVRDGAAFASNREPDSIEATNTVFLSVPALEPIPVGRITTALSATRYCFQEGFRDENGREIGFDNLAQVRELVRRAYLASGLGPGGTAAPAVALPAPEPGGTGGAYFDRAVRKSRLGKKSWYRGRHIGLARLFELDGALDELAELVQRFAEATILEWEMFVEREMHHVKMDHRVRQARWALREWYVALFARGVWNREIKLAEFALENRCPVGLELLHGLGRPAFPLVPWQQSVTAWSFSFHDRRYSDQELLLTAPCPLRIGWDPSIRRLADKLLLGFADASYFEVNNRVAELTPALLGALLCMPNTPRWHDDLDDGSRRSERIDASLTWLSRELPTLELPAVAERLLSDYARRQLHTSPSGTVR
jgi:hypothetical protein